jgi:hypothetical protein
MCYNAANHWDMGWFGNARRDLGSEGPSTPIMITLTAFTSYPSGNTVLIKVGKFYMQYNQAAAHNIDTDINTANQLIVVEKSSNLLTSRLAALDQGGEYNSGVFVVRVCAKQSTSMDISIGRSSTNCNAVSSAPPPPPVPQVSQPSTNWGNYGAPAPTVNWWSVSFPAPSTAIFSNPQPSPISWLRPLPPTTNWFQAPPSQPTWSWSSTGGSSPTPKSWGCFFGC